MERLPGFRDFYPDPVPHPDLNSFTERRFLFDSWRDVARRYGFSEYDGPPLEPTELYTTKSGQEILNQLYHFVDKGEREVALRPEMTPTLARMVAAHQRHYKKPIKWFSIPQLFRYERQQKGRLREHFQLNADIIGDPTAGANAELVALLIDCLRHFGLTSEDIVIRLSSRAAWEEFLKHRGIETKHAEAFYQVIDKIERVAPEETEEKLRPFGISLNEVNEFIDSSRPTEDLQQVLDNLKARGLDDYLQVDYRVIRGLAYYTGIVFEAFDQKRAFRAIAGGGRYDNLIGLISNERVHLSALGFGMGDVVLRELLHDRGLLPHGARQIDAYCLIEDEERRPETLRVVQRLRDEAWRVDYPFTPTKPDKQFKRALELGAHFTLTYEPGTPPAVRIKDLNSRHETRASLEELLAILSDKRDPIAAPHDTKPNG